ncbi:LCP family protein required for cell wall assembly [Nocardiopsis mwathae]|uniref:LCP family protein required for cell wall assembly n=1 Tax=Nocardiopsis mwathae TaxID=1472723 RepID=A0A7X0D3U1_9ACTN|nr:LCP family protein [Nocardiopsis mwathae]MBB6170553.1 LCP family protein required for cell wall assembly [Nocardiopsis mwathae]
MERLRKRGLRVVVAVLAAVAVVGGAVAAVGLWRLAAYDGNIDRIQGALPDGGVGGTADPGDTWLLVGSDLRGASTPTKWRPGEANADTVIVLHAPEGAERAHLISIPRDAWVYVPGHGPDRLSRAFREGGPRLLVEVVQRETGVTIDHFAAVDFEGFERMTDALGGVEVSITDPVYDPSNGWYWPAGANRMDGAQALRFVRERKGLPEGDQDRIKRQQAFLKAMAAEATSADLLADPVRLDAFLDAASASLAVDERVGMTTLRAMGARLAGVGPEGLVFVSLPIGSTGWIDGKNVAFLDQEVKRGVFAALREGTLEAYVAEFGLENAVDEVR